MLGTGTSLLYDAQVATSDWVVVAHVLGLRDNHDVLSRQQTSAMTQYPTSSRTFTKDNRSLIVF